MSCLHICGRCVHRVWRKSQLHGHTDLRGARKFINKINVRDRTSRQTQAGIGHITPTHRGVLLVLFLRTHSGLDRDCMIVAVQLAYLCLALGLDLDIMMLVLLRTAPGQSSIFPVERVMIVLNLAIQALALAREEYEADTEAALKVANGIKAMRQALTRKRTTRAQARMDLQLRNAPGPAAEWAAATDSGAPAACTAETCPPLKQSRAFGPGNFMY